MMDNLESTNSVFESLVIHFLEGSITGVEWESLRDLLEGSDKNRQRFQDMRRVWMKTSRVTIEERYDVDWAWQSLAGKLDRKSKSVSWRNIWRCAAVLVVLFAVGAWLIHSRVVHDGNEVVVAELHTGDFGKATLILETNEHVILGTPADTLLESLAIKNQNKTLDYKHFEAEKDSVKYNRLVTACGGEYSVVLADGTRVLMNAGSELRYPTRFTGEKREVFLTGEAYFEVTKDARHPFVVTSSQGSVRVLGTEFNMSCYDKEWMSATLVTGSVVVRDNENRSVEIRPGERVVLNKKGIEVSKVDVQLYTAWREGFFMYREERLDDILRPLARWYDFDYQYESAGLANELFTAKLKRFDRVEIIFRLLEEVGNVKFKKEGRTVIISRE